MDLSDSKDQLISLNTDFVYRSVVRIRFGNQCTLSSKLLARKCMLRFEYVLVFEAVAGDVCRALSSFSTLSSWTNGQMAVYCYFGVLKAGADLSIYTRSPNSIKIFGYVLFLFVGTLLFSWRCCCWCIRMKMVFGIDERSKQCFVFILFRWWRIFTMAAALLTQLPEKCSHLRLVSFQHKTRRKCERQREIMKRIFSIDKRKI